MQTEAKKPDGFIITFKTKNNSALINTAAHAHCYIGVIETVIKEQFIRKYIWYVYLKNTQKL